MSTRRGLQVVVALIVLVVLGAVLDAQGQVKIHCVDGWCVVPENLMRELVRQAEMAEQLAKLCKWTGDSR